jgi:hypothetical protein
MLSGMKAKHSAILLAGLMLLMIITAWAQTSNTVNSAKPSCPPIENEGMQLFMIPAGWVKANWNANTSRWDIDCTEFRAFTPPPNFNANGANAAPMFANAMVNAPTRRRSDANANYTYNGYSNMTNSATNAPAVNANIRTNRRRP